jgi:hypothetical protein
MGAVRCSVSHSCGNRPTSLLTPCTNSRNRASAPRLASSHRWSCLRRGMSFPERAIVADLRLTLRCRFRRDVLDRTVCRPYGAAVRAVMLTGLGAWKFLPLVNAALRPDVPTFFLAEDTCRLLDFVAGSHRRPFAGVVSGTAACSISCPASRHASGRSAGRGCFVALNVESSAQ